MFALTLETSILTIIVAISILANVALLWKFLKFRNLMLSEDPTDQETSETKNPIANDEGIIEFINAQLKETKGFLKDENQNEISVNSKVIALRTAYLNVEKTAYHRISNKKQYWTILNDRLLKVLAVFLPKLFGSESKLSELENRTKLLRERVKLMNAIKGTEPNQELRKSTDSFLNDIKGKLGEQETIDKYLSKLENMIEAFENPNVRRFYKNVFNAESFSQKSLKSFEKLYDNINNNLDSIKNLESQLSEAKTSTSETGDPSKYNAIEKELESYKQDNERLRTHLDALKKRIIDYEGAVQEKSKDVKVTILEGKNYDDIDSASNEIKRLSEEIIDIEEKEIDRLRGLINRQRKSITSLDVAIDETREQLALEKDQSESKDKEIEQLKNNLRESEICVSTLEQQMQELERNIGKEPNNDSYTQEDLTELNKEVNRLRADLDSATTNLEIDKSLIEFVNEAIEASSIEDLATLLYDQISRNEAVPFIELKYNNKLIVVSLSGKISSSDRIVFENMQSFEMNIDASGRSLKLNFPHIAGILRASENVSEFKNNKEKLINILKLTNHLVEKVGAQQSATIHKKDLEMHQNSIKKIAFELDKGMINQAKRSKNVVESCVGQIQDIALSAGMDKAKVDAFDEIKKDAFYQINSDEAFRLKARKQFLGLLKQFEKK